TEDSPAEADPGALVDRVGDAISDLTAATIAGTLRAVVRDGWGGPPPTRVAGLGRGRLRRPRRPRLPRRVTAPAPDTPRPRTPAPATTTSSAPPSNPAARSSPNCSAVNRCSSRTRRPTPG
ncbi:hypothetical protein JQK87_37130, partial [Streptomyces sp. G44]|nr:hypothetical protein [Streptomyces sp. G44]